MFDDLVVRELTNGTWFLLNATIILAVGRHLYCQIIRFGLRHLWNGLRDETSTGVQVAVALFVYFIGASIRAGWVWIVLFRQNLGMISNDTAFDQADWLLLAVGIGGIGALCCARIFSRDQWGHNVWMISGALAMALPAIVHFAARL